jgi:hypothetical protein
MEREVPNFNFMDIKQQFVFLMINKEINIISFISDTVLSSIVQWMEFGPSPVTVLLNQNHFQYCVLPYIFFYIIDYCLLHY